jgi:hypothetical protein
MTNIKEKVLREFGDHGADTLERYFTQIEYTAFWCIRMLYSAEEIEAVIPEVVEDVVVIQRGVYRLHQVKTRDESQGSWTTADVLPILCQQYHRRRAFPGECCFHFISNQMADTKTALRPGSYGPLYRLKNLLEILHDNQEFTSEEQKELIHLKKVLIPKIQETLSTKHNDTIDKITAENLLKNTWIQTDSYTMSNHNNLDELEGALSELFPGTPPCTMIQLKNMYDRLILFIVKKIITGKSLEDRRIKTEDVLNCRVASSSEQEGYPNLDNVPGTTPLDKKTRCGGFDPTEIPLFHKQKILAGETERRLRCLDLDDTLDHMITSILDLHRECRHAVCREQGVQQRPGPTILAKLRPQLGQLTQRFIPKLGRIDEQFCLGILWQQTNLCVVWWHELDSFAKEVII